MLKTKLNGRKWLIGTCITLIIAVVAATAAVQNQLSTNKANIKSNKATCDERTVSLMASVKEVHDDLKVFMLHYGVQPVDPNSH
jgi:hypothetical protein